MGKMTWTLGRSAKMEKVEKEKVRVKVVKAKEREAKENMVKVKAHIKVQKVPQETQAQVRRPRFVSTVESRDTTKRIVEHPNRTTTTTTKEKARANPKARARA